MTVIVDVDGTICTQVPGPWPDYAAAEPMRARIDRINRDYQGWRVVVATARGGMTGVDWRAVTEGQLDAWGLRYDELVIPKNKYLLPEYDLWIDDKAINARELDE